MWDIVSYEIIRNFYDQQQTHGCKARRSMVISDYGSQHNSQKIEGTKDEKKTGELTLKFIV